MPLSQDNVHRERASDFAVNVWAITTVDNIIYAPGQPATFEELGRAWANLYREDSVPVSTPGGEGAIKMVQAHLKRLFPDEAERSVLLSWMAHNVRYPGTKIRWAPYIYGAQGTGKTFIAQVLGMVMGEVNVQTVSGRLLRTDFNGWAGGSAVVAIEEVYQAGHLFETEENLKAPVSNDTVSIHRKGKDAYSARNRTNYLLLSNHPDGISVGEGDRRYFFLKVAMSAEEAKTLSRERYFDHLFDACRASPGGLRRWLETEVEIVEGFEPHGRAPETEARAQIVAMSKGDAEATLEDVFANVEVITSDWAAAVLKAADIEAPKTQAQNKMLARLGFEFHKRMRFGRRVARVYVRESSRNASDETIRKNLASRKVDGFDDIDDQDD
jgi:hypothetical protein